MRRGIDISFRQTSFVIVLQFVLLLSDAESTELLTVVGDISASSIRVLYDPLQPSLKEESTIDVLVSYLRSNDSNSALSQTGKKVRYDGLSDPFLTEEIPLSPFPRAIEVEELPEGSVVVITFRTKSGRLIGEVIARTLEASNEILNIPVVSCNRINEDNDTAFIASMNVDQSHRNGMVHLGDQVYADWQVDALRKRQREEVNGVADPQQDTASVAMNLFRSLYRKVWGNPAVHSLLASSPNWMIPDDHDITNNLDADKVVEAVAFEEMAQDNQATTDDLPNTPLSAIIAGRLAVYEYQRLLRKEIPSAHVLIRPAEMAFSSKERFNVWRESFGNVLKEFEHPRTTSLSARTGLLATGEMSSSDALYFWKKMNSVDLIFFDARFDRTFHDEAIQEALLRRKGEPPKETKESEEVPQVRFLSSHQWAFVKETMESLRSSDRPIVIFTSLPLVFVNGPLASLLYAFESDRIAGHPDHREEVGQLIEYLYPFRSRMLLVGGDVHELLNTTVMTESAVPHKGPRAPLSAISTSGLSRGSSITAAAHVYAFQLLWRLGQPFGPLSLTKTVEFFHDFYFIHNNYIQLRVAPCDASLPYLTSDAAGVIPLGRLSAQERKEGKRSGLCLEWSPIVLFLLISFIIIAIRRRCFCCRQKKESTKRKTE